MTRWHRAGSSLLLGVLAALLIGGCVPQRASGPAVPKPVQVLLDKYQLQASAQPDVSREIIAPSQLSYEPYVSASRAIGLDLAAHQGETAEWYSIPLRGKTDDSGPARAVFIISKGNVIGAGLSFQNAAPGVMPLSNREHFAN